MPKKRKRKRDDGHVDESWLLPYSDLLTLLLALFIVLFASSTIDEARFNQMSSVFNDIFDGGRGVMDSSSPTTVPVPQDDLGGENENSSYLEDQRSLGEIQDNLENYIAENELEGQFDTKLTEEGLLVTIRDSVLFSPGKAEIDHQYRELVEDIAKLLIFEKPRSIVVAGHTDNVPMQTGQYSSNWELSVMRAVNFLTIIAENKQVNPVAFSAKGYGEFRPIAKNDTEAGRAKNRRVEVLIQPLVFKDGSTTE
ncbi:flagellar motor protein MotB [Sporosarcina aquimarina]|uniref:Flagellar motor protein MotB n=1 Tax=Sporosarcina aquimarina TaxID=114975 RepID=A0ABU4G1K4_9BACL|nr:flagellar motor protein MotB [Sporosarcina aquimarina]MDW0110844.1 flagellar motor protein MotB [Sporosarcina aquimarina]